MKNLIMLCFVVTGFSAMAQQEEVQITIYPTANTQCQLQVHQILAKQHFDIDDPISEDARYVLHSLYSNLNLIYITDSKDPLLSQFVSDFHKTISEANQLNLNISMFKADIDYVASLK